MWRTQYGNSILEPKEAALFAKALLSLLDEPFLNDYEDYPLGIRAFDNLTYGQKISTLSTIANGLLNLNLGILGEQHKDSTGTMVAIGVANYLNTNYDDARYAVNRVSLFDSGTASSCHDIRPEVAAFSADTVNGEQCWVANYYSRDWRSPINGTLNVYFPHGIHRVPIYWNYFSLDEAMGRS